MNTFLLSLSSHGVEPRVQGQIGDFLEGASNVKKGGTSGLTAHSNRNPRLLLVTADMRRREYSEGRGLVNTSTYLCQIAKTRKRS